MASRFDIGNRRRRSNGSVGQRAAAKATEDDGLAPDGEIDNPKILDGVAAEAIPDTGRRVRALAEG